MKKGKGSGTCTQVFPFRAAIDAGSELKVPETV